MLSRVAEELYWIGRYVERAEDTSRLLDVHVHALLEDPWVDAQVASRDVLQVMGAPVPDGELDPRRVAEGLCFPRTVPGTISGALASARDAARGVREALSSELWEALNATYHALPTQEVAARAMGGPHGFFRYVRERSALVAGLLDTTMPRDDGWRFLVLGRSVERVDMTARLLRVRIGRSRTNSGWVDLLRSCSAHEAYLRTYRSAVEPERVVQFLVLDRLFPRSAFAALAQAEACLVQLDPTADRAGVEDGARRALGRARTDLEFRTHDELLRDLPELLDRLQQSVQEAGEALGARYFAHGPALSWTAEGEA